MSGFPAGRIVEAVVLDPGNRVGGNLMPRRIDLNYAEAELRDDGWLRITNRPFGTTSLIPPAAILYVEMIEDPTT